MSDDVKDPMWPHFAPLWKDLGGAVEKDLLIGGGYGLFLKQNWLLGKPDMPTIVPIRQWRDNTPRVTKDLDLVIGLDLIAEEKAQKGLLNALEKHAFKVSEKNPRWQFVKRLSETRSVIVELHAPLPGKGAPSFQTDRIRVKRKPSLGEEGIHGRTNPEAIGCDLKPFRFQVEGMVIPVPNPVTWSIMKLTATQDRWMCSEDANNSEERRSFSRGQAIKHAQDVCRVVAMVTRDERDTSAAVVEAVRGMPEFDNAASIVTDLFANTESWASQILSENWGENDLNLIRSTLAGWFH